MNQTQDPITVYSLAQTPLMEMGKVPGMGMPSRLALHRELARSGFNVVFYEITDAPQRPPETIEGIEVRHIRLRSLAGKTPLTRAVAKYLNLPLWVARAAWTLLPVFLRRKRAGERFILYGHNQYAAIAASVIATLLRVPNVTRLYGTLAPYMIGLSEHYPKSRLQKLYGYMRLWEDIVAVSMPASRYIITNDGTLGDKLYFHLKGKDDRLVFVRNGIDIDWNYWVSVPDDRSIVSELFENDDPVIVSAGRLIEWKRMERIIEVARRVIASGVDANFLIMGNGDTQRSLQTQIDALGLTRRVRILTTTPHSQMPRYLKAATAVLLLQDFTNLSNTLLESLSLEKPVVALDVGGTNTVVVDGVNGLLVPLNNWAGAAANAIAKLVSSEELRDSLAEGCRLWKARCAYDWSVRSRIDQKVITDLLGAGDSSLTATQDLPAQAFNISGTELSGFRGYSSVTAGLRS